mgnify:FL=1
MESTEQKKERAELLKKLIQEIDQALSLSNQELLKSSELYDLESGIYALLNEIRDTFGDIQSRKIEKATPLWKTVPRAGSYAKLEEAVKKLLPLKVLLEELCETETGIKPTVIPPIDTSTNPSLREAIRDAQLLFDANGAPNAVDRFHTLLQAYLEEQCTKASLSYNIDATINTLLKLLREKHPALLKLQSNQPEVVEILKGMSNTLDKLSTLRNNKSLAHPNELLPLDEATFVIDSVNTILKYLSSKLGE